MYLTAIDTWDKLAILGLLAFLAPPWFTCIIAGTWGFHRLMRYASTGRSTPAGPPPPPAHA